MTYFYKMYTQCGYCVRFIKKTSHRITSDLTGIIYNHYTFYSGGFIVLCWLVHVTWICNNSNMKWANTELGLCIVMYRGSFISTKTKPAYPPPRVGKKSHFYNTDSQSTRIPQPEWERERPNGKPTKNNIMHQFLFLKKRHKKRFVVL